MHVPTTRNLEINLSRTLGDRLARLGRKAETQAWLAANRKAIDAYNARVERDGVWSEKLRGF
jgi:antitoxin CcdA